MFCKKAFNSIFHFVVCCFLLTASFVYGQHQLTFVSNGKSDYCIVIPKNASSAIIDASIEFQKCLFMATGVQIAVVNDHEKIKGSYISIGHTKYVIKEKIDVSDLVYGGYRWQTKANNLFIVGIDTPNDEVTLEKGISNGSSNGVYSFLEKYLDVRWLLPGDLGLDVPKTDEVIIPKLACVYNPNFLNRRISNLTKHSNSIQKRNVIDWMNKQKIAEAYSIDFQHSWYKIVNKDPQIFAKHPDWFALYGGTRVKPDGKIFKFETTNPELVKYVADQAVIALKGPYDFYTYSLSPNDDRFWSESEESKSFYDPAIMGRTSFQTTRLIFKWYDDIARLVEKKCDECKLAGYFYSDYLFPHKDLEKYQFPKNFIPVLAMSNNYGYSLFNENNRQQTEYVLKGWRSSNPRFWLYYDMPNLLFENDIHLNNFPGTVANITPVGTEILNYLFPLLDSNKLNGVSFFGSPSWSSSALSNYVISKMMWNPDLNAKTLQDEWLIRAYGVEAGQILIHFYEKLEGWYKQHYKLNNEDKFKFNSNLAKQIYAKNMDEIESSFLQAKNVKKAEIQAKRFQLLYDNFLLLYWRLFNEGLLETKNSSLITDRDAEQLLLSANDEFQMFPGIIPIKRESPTIPEYRITAVDSIQKKPQSKKNLARENKNTYIFYSQKSQQVSLRVQQVKKGLIVPCYLLKDKEDNLIDSGILYDGKQIQIDLEANKPVYFFIPERSKTEYSILVDNANILEGEFDKQNNEVFVLRNNKLYIQTYSSSRELSQTKHGVIIN